jgi:hypothetical protein
VKSSDIGLDPDIFDSGNNGQIPLSDLYTLSVFAEDVEQRAAEGKRKEKENLEELRHNLFQKSKERETEKLKKIHKQIFQTVPMFVETEELKRAERIEEPEEVQSVFLMAETAAVVLIVFFLAYEKKRMKLIKKRKRR